MDASIAKPPRSKATAFMASSSSSSGAHVVGHRRLQRSTSSATRRHRWLVSCITPGGATASRFTFVTTPVEKRLYLDPLMLPLLEGRRIVLVDDVVSDIAPNFYPA